MVRSFAFAPILAWGVALLTGCAPAPVDDAELARRIEAARPTWESYQEDVKGQIGAAPVAEWVGTLESVRTEAGTVEAAFRLDGPWAERDLFLPVVIKDPLGGVRRAASARRQGRRVTYVFPLPEASLPPSWVELKYPRHETRVMLSSAGTWEAE